VEILHDPVLNKGTAFTLKEREALGLTGLLPHAYLSIEQQCAKVKENYDRKPNDLEKWIFLTALQDRNETLFYRVLHEHIEEMMPIVYTPVVGEACQKYSATWRRPRGLYIRAEDRGRIAQILRHWPEREVGVIVVTDGERILGLGDLGANGMGIPVGKLTLYTACAGVHPCLCLPITLDVGTNNQKLLDDPLYIGVPHQRIDEESYDALLDEFVEAVQTVFPTALLQFEDFHNRHAFRLLSNYRDKLCCFNDDIQGTAGVTLAGLLSALRISGKPITSQKYLFFGAGEAGIGIGELVASALQAKGLPHDEAHSRCLFLDSKGLVVKSRTDLQEHKLAFAHDLEFCATLEEAIRRHRPTALIGVSGQPQTFTREVVQAMAEVNERPIIFALSNPTSKAECTAAQAYDWTNGRAIFASGSPFPAHVLNGQRFVPGQANNAYVFPGVGLGVTAVRARRVTDEMFFAAAETLAAMASEDDLAKGCIFPALTKIREVSAQIACAVAEVAYRRHLASLPRPLDLLGHIQSVQYWPEYEEYIE
jgi:malate dehydrogenase (oxaloacetate-decarboxylating)(NADP+)